jgi:glycosyltransferase involved in cell wall biosynthesis
MRLGIDASNLLYGGGVTHLVELMRAARPEAHGFDQVIVWGNKKTLGNLEGRPWLACVHEPLLDRSLPVRQYWQRTILEQRARQSQCDLLFVPGGSYLGAFRPFVTMSRSMLPFEYREAFRYGCSWMSVRNVLLRWSQTRSFRSADGLVFLTRYAQEAVTKAIKDVPSRVAIIPHGVDPRFRLEPREQRPPNACTWEKPFRLLYVSIVDVYKHQWHVVRAVAQLRKMGLPVQLDLIGPAYASALKRLERIVRQLDGKHEFINYLGPRPYAELAPHYHRADLFVFASSCENLPNILLEAMAAGLPIACSRRGPMPEVAGDAAVYFDPEDPAGIADALRQLIADPVLRATKAKIAFQRAGRYLWHDCAEQMFRFLSEAACAAHHGNSIVP